MDTASLQFVLFGLAVALVSNFRRSAPWRLAVLLLGSFTFLTFLSHSAVAFLPLLGFLLLGYSALALIERGWAMSRVIGIVAVILAFLWLKKYTVLPERVFMQFPYIALGISYIFFRMLHLLIEHSPKSTYGEIGLARYLAYTLNFTTFVSGPIQRYDEFARDQFADVPIPLDLTVIGLQLERIVRGLFKVNVLALLFDMIHVDALSQLSAPLPVSQKIFAALRLAIAYPFFLYNNFSGYIDIVIAIGRLLRLRLPENFDRPFSAVSFMDFWNRWHITLSTWLKTYVYNTLLVALARRVSSAQAQSYLGVLCFFVTFFLVGIWHGRTTEFLIFGVLQGGGVATVKLWQIWLIQIFGSKNYRALTGRPAYIMFARGLTFTWFAFTLFWFWASWSQLEALRSALSAANWLLVWFAAWIASTVVLAAWEWLRGILISPSAVREPWYFSRYARVAYATAFALILFVMGVVLNQPAPDIVYKAF
jgi:alginate O-acetyltransferase complex protein AlgI